jgi:hypothetical protein
MSGTMKLPPFLQPTDSASVHRPKTHDWQTEVAVLQGKGNMYTVCVFIEPGPALREKFDGTPQCTQGGHSLFGKVPEAETARGQF